MVSKLQLEQREQRAAQRAHMSNEYMSIPEVAKALGVVYSRALKLISTGRIPAVRYSEGGQNSPKWLVSREDFETFAQTKRYTGRPRIGDMGRLYPLGTPTPTNNKQQRKEVANVRSV